MKATFSVLSLSMGVGVRSGSLPAAVRAPTPPWQVFARVRDHRPQGRGPDLGLGRPLN